MPRADTVRTCTSALIILATASLAWAQEQPPAGPVSAGTLQLACAASNCTVTAPWIGAIEIDGDRARVIAAYPGGTHPIRLSTPRGDIEGKVAICGRATIVLLMPDRIETTSDACPPMASLVVEGISEEATVRVDGLVAALDGAATTAVYAGDYEITVERPRFQDFVTRVSLQEGEVERIEVTSARLPGTLVLEGDLRDARIYLDGELRVDEGTVAGPGSDFEVFEDVVRAVVPIGPVNVRVERDGFRPFERTIAIESEGETALQVELTPLPASVTLLPFPEDAVVTVDGRQVATGRPITLAPGVRTLAATASGFEPLEQGIEISPGETTEVRFELIGRPVTLRVRGAPPGANVAVDGADPLPAEGVVAVRPGLRSLRFTAAGYAPLVRELLVTTELLQTIEVDLQRLARLNLARLSRTSRVTIDGDTYRASEGTIEVPPGAYEVFVQSDGFESAEVDLRLAPGEEHVLEPELTPLPATITIPDVPAGIRATLDGVLMQMQGETIGPIEPGRYVLSLESEIHRTVTLDLELDPGESLDLSDIEFEFRQALLVLEGAPEGTRVKIDDSDVTTYEAPIEVEPGEHVVWIAADGFGRYRITIDVGPAERATVPVEFE